MLTAHVMYRLYLISPDQSASTFEALLKLYAFTVFKMSSNSNFLNLDPMICPSLEACANNTSAESDTFPSLKRHAACDECSKSINPSFNWSA